jgi:predicted transcriptional regulator
MEPNMTPKSDLNDKGRGTAQALILAMVASGATKTAIAKAVGVSDMTIMSVAKGTTVTFRKLPTLQKVYEKWKAGKLDLAGKHGKKMIDTASVAEGTQPMKPRKSVKAVPPVKAKRVGKPKMEVDETVAGGFQLPEITDEMVAEVEEQIRMLQHQLRYMKGLIAIRKKYGQ